MLYLPPANEVWGKVIFSEACVKNSVQKRGGLPQCMLGYHTPQTRHPPLGADAPHQTPPRSACWEIWSTRRAVYILLECNLVSFLALISWGKWKTIFEKSARVDNSVLSNFHGVAHICLWHKGCLLLIFF